MGGASFGVGRGKKYQIDRSLNANLLMVEGQVLKGLMMNQVVFRGLTHTMQQQNFAIKTICLFKEKP